MKGIVASQPAAAAAAKSLQSYPTLGDPMDCSLPGFSVHGIFQARALEWGAIAFSRAITTPLSKWLIFFFNVTTSNAGYNAEKLGDIHRWWKCKIV